MYTLPLNLNEPLYKIRGVSKSSKNEMYGIEIELEGKNILGPTQDPKFTKLWEAVTDNSLKAYKPGDQTIEYRFIKPLDLDGTELALKMIEEGLTKPDVTIYHTGRTSVHVHVNMLNDSMATIYNYITLLSIFDELLVSQNGKHRIGNNFCLRAKDAEGFLISMSQSLAHYGNLSALQHNNRYSSVNVMSLFKQGTIELRSMECTIDRQRLMHWVKTLAAIKDAAKDYKNPLEIVGAFSQFGPERFFLKTLGAHAVRYMKVVDRHRMLFHGMRLVQELANSTTWEPLVLKEGEEPKKAYPYGKKKKITSSSVQAYYEQMIAHANAAHAGQQVNTAAVPTGAVEAPIYTLPPGWGEEPEEAETAEPPDVLDILAEDDDDQEDED